MADKPRRPILHLKFPSASPSESDTPAGKSPPAARVPLEPRAPLMAPAARPGRTVREFKPAAQARPPRAPRPPRFEAPLKPKAFDWKCKPCGKGVDVAAELADEDAVRCPSCNARLGLAKDFRSDPPNVEKVRARFVGV
jgi:DNA-directed RNA polymerase subunit RPC12/RpoP